MIKIQKLIRPSKRSGYELAPLAKTEVRGLIIINKNKHTVYVDKWTRPKPKKKARKKNV